MKEGATCQGQTEGAGQSHQGGHQGQVGGRAPRDRIPNSDKKEQENGFKIKLFDMKEQERVEEIALRPAIPGSKCWKSRRVSAGEQAGPSRSSIPEPRGSARWSSLW